MLDIVVASNNLGERLLGSSRQAAGRVAMTRLRSRVGRVNWVSHPSWRAKGYDRRIAQSIQP